MYIHLYVFLLSACYVCYAFCMLVQGSQHGKTTAWYWIGNLIFTMLKSYICDRICKKGSYTCTTSTHRFHHHSIDTLSDNPWVHVLWPTVHQSAFPEAVSGACQTSMNARFVSSCPCWLLNKGHRAVRSHTTL